MCCHSTSFIEIKDILILILGFLLSILWTLVLYKLKPKLEIVSVDKSTSGDFWIKIQNNGCFDAVNLQMEVCTIKRITNDRNKNDKTDHFTVDKDDFLLLPSKRNKVSDNFRLFEIKESHALNEKFTNYYKKSGLQQPKEELHLRIRLHATHEYSGFGKAFEKEFYWNNGNFIRI